MFLMDTDFLFLKIIVAEGNICLKIDFEVKLRQMDPREIEDLLGHKPWSRGKTAKRRSIVTLRTETGDPLKKERAARSYRMYLLKSSSFMISESFSRT